MNAAAPAFIGIVQNTLWEDVLLHIARLTDPPHSVHRANLTIRSLARLVKHPETKATVKALTNKALVASSFCRDWRNRRLAHIDLLLALGERAMALEPASRQRPSTPSMRYSCIVTPGLRTRTGMGGAARTVRRRRARNSCHDLLMQAARFRYHRFSVDTLSILKFLP